MLVPTRYLQPSKGTKYLHGRWSLVDDVKWLWCQFGRSLEFSFLKDNPNLKKRKDRRFFLTL